MASGMTPREQFLKEAKTAIHMVDLAIGLADLNDTGRDPEGLAEVHKQGEIVKAKYQAAVDLFEANTGEIDEWTLEQRVRLWAEFCPDDDITADMRIAADVIRDYETMIAATGEVYDDRLAPLTGADMSEAF